MISWLLTNCLLSGLALTYIHLNRTSPHRLRFLAGFTALCAWLVPWQSLNITLPALPTLGTVQNGLNNALPLTSVEYTFEITSGPAGSIGFSLGQILFLLLMAAAIPGVFLFMSDTWRQ